MKNLEKRFKEHVDELAAKLHRDWYNGTNSKTGLKDVQVLFYKSLGLQQEETLEALMNGVQKDSE